MMFKYLMVKAFLLCFLLTPAQAYKKEVPVFYSIDMTGPSTDTFQVEVRVAKLRKNNDVYQFAATAPGTYSIMDIGRFVTDFKAFDKNGKEVPVSRVQVNQFRLSNPTRVRRITYKVAETWDTPVVENQIYPMGGTSLEKDHALLNMHCLLGYFAGMQDADMEIKLNYPGAWKLGSPLVANDEGLLTAPDFDFAVDSPVLLGRLSTASLDVGGKTVDIFVYSKTDQVEAAGLMTNMKSIFEATNAFVKGFPIDRYVLLFHFEDLSFGAWEHSYSSEYVLKEGPLTPDYVKQIKAIASHEIFHMITPLNIHSDVIEQFNFVTPTPSQHLWLYEGVTEWAAQMIMLRGGLASFEDMLAEISNKLVINDQFDKDYSLHKLAMTSYAPEGKQQYVNIYYKGALVPMFMDILLLEKSGGQRGLREVILELSKKYGPQRAFSESDFFKEFVQLTDPAMQELIDRYIMDSEPLPVAEYMKKLGVDYVAELKTGEMIPDRGHSLSFDGQRFVVSNVSEKGTRDGLRDQDAVLTINGVEAKPENLSDLMPVLNGSQPGDTVRYRIQRGEQELDVSYEIGERENIRHHILTPDPEATPAQLSLREAWMKPLK